ncbi:10105_t:CDS:2, partial [Gigaspora margarita]
MPKETSIKALQKKKAQEKKNCPAIYIENSKCTWQRRDKAFREAAVGSLKISQFFSNNQQLVTNNDKSSRDFQDQNNQGDKASSEESGKELDEKKKFHYTIEFVTEVMTLKSRRGLLYDSPLFSSVALTRKELIQPDLRKKSPSKSLLHDELVSFKVASYLRFQKFKVDPIIVKSYFEQQILPQLNIESVNIFQSELPRSDVIEYRKIFLQEVSQLERFMSKWNDPDCKIRTFPDLNNGENELVWVTHDKTTFYIYDRPHSVWGPEKEQPLYKKGLGSAIHISDFLTETIEPLKYDQEKAHIMMILDANRDGYWNSVKLLEQVQQAIKIFERTHPGCVGIFAFDNATSHKAFSEDALVALKMNLDPEADPNVIDCCTCRLIANQPDFLEQHDQIQQEIKSRGYKGNTLKC